MKESIYSKFVVLSTVFLCVFFDLVVMGGWFLHLPWLVQLTPESVPVHFNTAFTFFLFGAALLCLFYKRFLPLALLLGLLVTCIGAITLSEDLYSFNAGIDELFVKDYIQVKTSSPGRMSPNTSLPFILEGLALFLLALQPKKRWSLLSTIFLAILVFCIGFTSIFGYVLDIESAYAWGHLSHLSLQSAIIFSLSGISLILISFRQAREEGVVIKGFYPFLAGALFFFQSILLSVAIEGEQNEHITKFVEAQAVEIKSAITNSFTDQGNVLFHITSRWENSDEITHNEWLVDAKNIIKDRPGWQYVVLTDKNLRIMWIAPEALLHTHVHKQLVEEGEINRASEPKIPKMILSNATWQKPILLIYTPIFKNTVFQGIEAIGIEPKALFEYLLKDQIDFGNFIEILVNEQQIFSSSNEKLADFDFENTQTFAVDDLLFTLKVTVTAPLLHGLVLSKASFLVLGIGIALAFLLALYVRAFLEVKTHLGEVERSEERFRFASKATNDILWDWHIRDGQFLISENVKLFGYLPKAVQHRRAWWLDHVHPDDRGKLDELMKTSLKRRMLFWNYEYRFARNDGTYANILDRAYILYDENGQPFRAIGAMMDITERKTAEQRKNEFISTVSHELRTPLTSIKGSLALLLSNTAGVLPPKAVQLLKISSNNCDRLVRLIATSLDIERIESNKGEFIFKPVDLVELVKESIQENKTYAMKGIEILFNPQISSGVVLADHDRLCQVMDNLLSNAIKFSPPGKQVVITIERIQNSIRVSVADEGVGISLEFQKRLFEKFARSDNPASSIQGGTGLGLSISKAIIVRHKGLIGFCNREPLGTIFYFEIPENTDEAKSEDDSRGDFFEFVPHILVCEDDAEFAKLIKSVLEKERAVVDIAPSTAQAKVLLNTKRYDLLVVDIAAADQNGISFAKALRLEEKTKTLPIIIISYTGSTSEQLFHKKPFSVISYLEKPFSLSELKEIIDKVPSQDMHLKRFLRILYVEDEKDIPTVVKMLLGKSAFIDLATTIEEAKRKLSSESYDLMLLDIRLPDGSGLSLLPCVDYKTKSVIPTIIFSASESPTEFLQFVSVSLHKPQESNEKLLHAVRNILQKVRT